MKTVKFNNKISSSIDKTNAVLDEELEKNKKTVPVKNDIFGLI
jgi:hypothetical protein